MNASSMESPHVPHDIGRSRMIAVAVVVIVTGAFIGGPLEGWHGTLIALALAGMMATMVGYAFTH